jgi:hypothetical protein
VTGGWFVHFANPQLLNKEARVLFYGCNVGEGAKGDLFMAEIGRYLLTGKGGYVGATTSKNIGILEAYMLPWGRLKVKRYGVSGSEIGASEVGPFGSGTILTASHRGQGN